MAQQTTIVDGVEYVLVPKAQVQAKGKKPKADEILPQGVPKRWHRSLFGLRRGKVMVQYTGKEKGGDWYVWPHETPPEGAQEV